MTAELGDVFADTVFWIALVVRQDAHHRRAQAWVNRIHERIITTTPVLLETASALAPLSWRPHAVALIDHLRQRQDVRIVDLTSGLFDRAWTLYRNRLDKAWSLVDCVSFVVMEDCKLTVALTADHHFEQAGYRAALLEEPA